MKVLFFDTETNGKPIDYKAPITNLDNWPRIIQLGWVFDDDGVITEMQSLIKPDGWEIPEEDFWINHGYSTEGNELLGSPMPEVLERFCQDLSKADVVVAHNIAFDYPITAAEMIRYGISPEKKSRQKICTMESSTNYCKIPGKYRNWKWPNLTELHEKLFNEGFDGAHDALSDVRACARCFNELVKLGVITVQV